MFAILSLSLMLFVRLFDLCLFGFVGFLFLLGSGKGCCLWLWRSLDFSLTFFFKYCSFFFKALTQSKLNDSLQPSSITKMTSYGKKKKKVREKSRECHNHKPQPFPDPKRKRKPTKKEEEASDQNDCWQEWCLEQLKKYCTRYKKIGILRQTACLAVNPIMVDNIAPCFNYTNGESLLKLNDGSLLSLRWLALDY